MKNLAVRPQAQRSGYGRKMIEFLCEEYKGKKTILQAGTGDSPATLSFYEACGFTQSHRIPCFFVDNYDHPIIECGKQLVDMVYLRKNYKLFFPSLFRMEVDSLHAFGVTPLIFLNRRVK